MDNTPDMPPPVEGDEIENDESRTPTQFADDEMLTVEQAAHFMSCSAAEVRSWIENGSLMARAEGSIQRVKRSDLERMGNPDQTAAQEFETEHGA